MKYRAPDTSADGISSTLHLYYHQLWICLTVHSTNETPLPFPLLLFSFLFISTPLTHGINNQPVNTITPSLILRTASALVEGKMPHGTSQV